MIFLWTALYGLTFNLSRSLSVNPWATPLAMGAYMGALVLWLVRSGRSRSLGLCMPRGLEIRDLPQLLPLLILPAYNLLTGELPDLPTALLMLFVSVSEEIFFRGFLLRFLLKWGAASGIMICAGVFALFHGVNLLRGGDPVYTALQILCAAGAGICYGAVTLRWGSILPAMAAHALTNITGAGNEAASPALLLCAAAWGIYGIWICRKIR